MRILLTLFFFLIPVLSFANQCVPKVNSCGFYICEEKKFDCGPKGYPIAFGNKFCNVFLNTEDQYSDSAKGWLQRVRVCLMKKLQKIATDEGLTCGGLRDQGFRSHVGCYLDTGFCELKLKDKVKIGWAMKKSFVHQEVLRDGIAMKRACTKKGLNLVFPNGPR